MKKNYLKPLIRNSLMKADRVIPVSNHLKDSVQKLGIDKKKLSYIHNGIDRDMFYPLSPVINPYLGGVRTYDGPLKLQTPRPLQRSTEFACISSPCTPREAVGSILLHGARRHTYEPPRLLTTRQATARRVRTETTRDETHSSGRNASR